MKSKFFACLFLFFVSSAQGTNEQTWGELASLNRNAIEKSSIAFVLKQMPHLNDVEIKLVQINAQYHKSGFSLESLFIHANSFKPISENKTLGIQDLSYGISHYMERIRVEFSDAGIPKRIGFTEPLLGKNREESLERFKEFYDSF